MATRPATRSSSSAPPRVSACCTPPGRDDRLISTFDDLRSLCLALPETEESTSYGTPAFKVKGKMFCRLRDEDGLLAVFVGDLEEKEALLTADPKKFRTTPHYDGYAMVLLHLPSLRRRELGELLTDSWRLKAPVKVLRAFDESGGTPPR